MTQQFINKLISALASIFTAMIIMILHEFPKALIYKLEMKKYIRKGFKARNKKLFNFIHYIDPIGVIFFMTTYSGFSKPYLYKIRERKLAIKIGISGYISLICTFFLGIFLIKLHGGVFDEITGSNEFIIYLKLFVNYVLYFSVIFSMTMLITNLFPISVFDMGFIIAGKSPSIYFRLIKNDYIIKIIYLFAALSGVLANIGMNLAIIFI